MVGAEEDGIRSRIMNEVELKIGSILQKFLETGFTYITKRNGKNIEEDCLKI